MLVVSGLAPQERRDEATAAKQLGSDNHDDTSNVRRWPWPSIISKYLAELAKVFIVAGQIVKAPTLKAMTETPLEGDAMMILKAKMMAGK